MNAGFTPRGRLSADYVTAPRMKGSSIIQCLGCAAISQSWNSNTQKYGGDLHPYNNRINK